MQNKKEVLITLKAVDEASDTIKNVVKQITELGKGGDLSGLAGKLNKVKTMFGGMKGKIGLVTTALLGAVKGYDKLYQASKKNFTQGLTKILEVCQKVGEVLSGAFSGFMGLVGNITGQDLSFGGLIQSALDYEHQMNRVKAVVQANDKQFADLENKAQELGASTVFTAGQVAQAMEELGQNGMTADKILKSIGDTLDLAVVGNLELSDSAYIVSSALNSFGYESDQATRIVDLMSGTALSSGATVEDFGETLKYTGSVAGSLGVPIEHVATLTGIMGNAFVKGSRAGTSLRSVMANMSKPTKNMIDVIDKYNLEGARQKIINGDLIGGMKEMSTKLNGLSQEEKLMVATTLAGKYGLAGFLSIINAGVDGIDEMTESIKKNGDASATAQEYIKSLEGQMFIFVSQLQAGALKIKEALEDGLAKGMETLNNFIGMLIDGKIIQAFQYLATESYNWGRALAKGIENAIASIGKFISGGGLDAILKVGTNIIQGICQGITNSYNSGTLTTTITNLIGKIADWITTNAPAIQRAGSQILDAIKVGIENNSDKIRSAMEGICGIIEGWVSGTTAISSLMGQFADIMITSFINQTRIKMSGRVTELWSAMNVGEVTSKAQDSGMDTGNKYTKGATDGLESGKATIVAKGSEVGTATADAIGTALETMDTGTLNKLSDAITEVGDVTSTTADSMRDSFGGIRNGARDSFMGVTNIVRNQMLNVSNIIRNQITNARNSFTQQMMSMSAVARNQMANVYSTVSSYMAKIKASVSQSMNLKVNVSKTVTTSYVNKGEQGFGTMALLSNMTGSTMAIPQPSTMATASTIGGTYGNSSSNSGSYEFSIPLYIDGKEIAKATATYNQEQLNKLEKRKSRKRGE